MISLPNAVKLAPVLALALLAVGTSLQVGCRGVLMGVGLDGGGYGDSSDDAVSEDGPPTGCTYGYAYRYGYSYGYGCNYGR